MSPLKLKKLPNRETAKITFTASADLQQMLAAYANLYEAEYGEREAITDLIPYMLETFVGSDRQFRTAKSQPSQQAPSSSLKPPQTAK
ncbi:DUF2274 domain-containing protein [Hoeflea poritis]|uniref:DUF2274 domain-containing protein n=1 Tax=Hoeflea poritis TaxID=2993659 RepID=A0ABT4VX19_9HYPH|nr:DUF2274 domain-containing protein [Hoeflea poritis]MDA4848587.1 DUF2274 domain-containing protein [Hoeflea poritis]